ncbi:hemerythrin domain-containing protein [Myxococcota bacterium]|nr:hemerythrin domain-containing protein [Myxococcota bacterium]
MSAANDPTRTPSPAERQHQQHASIRALLADVQRASGPEGLAPLLDEMALMLQEHFGHEEAEGGVFDGIVEADPMRQGRVEELVRDHRDFVDRLDRARAALGTSGADALAMAHALAADISTHEAVENELLADALYDEMQGHD